MDWKYAPVAIAEQDREAKVETFSGVFITNGLNEGYVLTVNKQIEGKVYVTMPNFITDEKVEWVECKKVNERKLDDTEKALNRFKGGYTVEPSSSIILSVFKFESMNRLNNAISISNKFKLCRKVDGKIKVHCSPFASVNPALFVGYMAHGSVGYIGKDIILSDVRYLEGMNGGIVFQDGTNESIGLIAGKIRKLNKDGESTVVVPWRCINTSKLLPMNTSSSLELIRIFQGVVALTVKRRDGAVLWGSGVLIDNETIATNAHVVNNPERITVAFNYSHTCQAELTGVPIDGMDLAFLKLTPLQPQPHQKPHGFKPLKLRNTNVATGISVKSIGYGIYNPEILDNEPLISTGYVSRVVEHRLHDNSTNALNTQALIVASSGCWNGSSGGAVVDNENKLVGIMASNGKMNDGEIIPTLAFVIPWQVVEYAWHLLKLGKNVTLSPRLQKMWQLDQTHENVLSKL